MVVTDTMVSVTVNPSVLTLVTRLSQPVAISV